MKDHEINRRSLINTTAVGATAGRWAFLEQRRGGWAEERLDQQWHRSMKPINENRY